MTRGERIQKLREEAGLSTQALADICLMRNQYLEQIEDDIVVPHTRTYQKIADALGVRLQHILGEEELPRKAKLSDELDGPYLVVVQGTMKLIVLFGTLALIGVLLALGAAIYFAVYRTLISNFPA
jgi:transcriptional regulator with XRE-family HTH domain